MQGPFYLNFCFWLFLWRENKKTENFVSFFSDLYSFQIIPVIGQLLVGDFNSYKYLVESIRVFPDQQKFSKMVKEAGFNNVTFEELNFGICNIYCGIK